MPESEFRTIPPIEDALFLTGPTAGGKTRAGIRLAQAIDAEIISLDSMAIYRMMDIGTAKPLPEEREGVPHHLIDIVDPWEEFSLADYLKAATEAAGNIRSRGRKVLFVGGTPLYLKSCLSGIFEGPPADQGFREKMAEREAADPGTLHRELSERAPLDAERLHPNDTRRIIRALEVLRVTGRQITEFQTQFKSESETGNRVFVLSWPREVLYARINARVDAMMAAGFLDEVERLQCLGRPMSKTALQGVGYRELPEALAGRVPLADAVEKIKLQTRHFAKNQETWFRSLANATAIPMVRTEESSGQSHFLNEFETSRAILDELKGNSRH